VNGLVISNEDLLDIVMQWYPKLLRKHKEERSTKTDMRGNDKKRFEGMEYTEKACFR
jgi:hypothetical protein